MILCKDCKYCEPLAGLDRPDLASCVNPLTVVRSYASPVDGSTRTFYRSSINDTAGNDFQAFCEQMRKPGSLCNPDATLFEPLTAVAENV